jgi:hypothetical protein
MEFYEGTQGQKINFQLCAYLCKKLGFKDWYPKYHPKGMGKKDGWGSYREKNKRLKQMKKSKLQNK